MLETTRHKRQTRLAESRLMFSENLENRIVLTFYSHQVKYSQYFRAGPSISNQQLVY